jgi:hypothetical protein
MTEEMRMGWTGHVTRLEVNKNAQTENNRDKRQELKK